MKNLSDLVNEGLIKQTKQEFVIIKPGFLPYSTQIMSELLAHGFIVRNRSIKILSLKAAKKLYSVHKEEPFYDDLCKYMSSNYSMGLTLLNTKGEDLGIVKDIIRKEFGVDDMRNAIHSSDSVANMKRESKIYFNN